MNNKPQVYAVVSEDQHHHDDTVDHVVVHGEAITPMVVFDKRKRELCLSFTGGIAVGMLLLSMFGGLHHHGTPTAALPTPPVEPTSIQLPVVENVTDVQPFLPPAPIETIPPQQDLTSSSSEDEEEQTSSWWSKTTDTVSGWFGGDKPHLTKTSGGGRDWLVNAQTGTVASKMDPTYLLGVSPAPLVLVRKESEQKLSFLQSPSRALKDVDLVAQDNEFVGFAKEEGVEVEGYEYFETATSPFLEPLSVTYQDDNFLVFSDDYVLDVALWQIVENQKVNFVKALDGSTFTSGGGRDWVWNDDGSVSPKLNLGLVLGMGPRGLSITRKEEQALRLSHAQELANGDTVPMELNGELKVVGTGETKTADGWDYRETILVEDGPIHIQYDGNFILTSDQDYCLDIAYWQLEEGNVVNFVGGD